MISKKRWKCSMVKIIRVIAVIILIFFTIKICTKKDNPPVDYNTRVKIHIGKTEGIGNYYTTPITFTNIYDYSLSDITVKFSVGTIDKPMIEIRKDILPSNYQLLPQASYTYNLSTKDYWYIHKVTIIYAN